MERLTRRQILGLLAASGVTIHCGSSADDSPSNAETPISSELASTATPRQMLNEIDHFVVLMMENRSFDHYMGALKREKGYANHDTVNGSSLSDFNVSPEGNRIHIYPAKTFKLQSPPHSYEASHAQFNGGKNDKFVIENRGSNQDQVMAYYDRKTIPFYYWLADHFTVFDNWHASVMGPTIPNRLYLNCGTSADSENNDPITKNEPDTIWDQLRAKGISAKSYHAGRGGLMGHALPNKTHAGKIPFAKIKEFYDDAKNGTLPHVSYIEPDYGVSDDHPAHDIRLGQAFVNTVYKKLAASPQWSKSLLIVLYDEHGGFWDHVPPPQAPDADAAFQRYGFRVPAFVAGPSVKRGHLATGLHDHTSVLATLSLRFGLDHLTKRSANASTIEHVLDPAFFKKPSVAPMSNAIPLDAEALMSVGESSQDELEAALENGDIPAEYVDDRPIDERVGEWLAEAQALGAVQLLSEGPVSPDAENH